MQDFRAGGPAGLIANTMTGTSPPMPASRYCSLSPDLAGGLAMPTLVPDGDAGRVAPEFSGDDCVTIDAPDQHGAKRRHHQRHFYSMLENRRSGANITASSPC